MSLAISEHRELEVEVEPPFVEDLDEIPCNDVQLPLLSLALGCRT